MTTQNTYDYVNRLTGRASALSFAYQYNTAGQRKGDAGKVKLAASVRAETTMPLAWIAARLRMGRRGYLGWLPCQQGKTP